ncbi:hypothetical protein RUM43_010759 [Polyplax serrata]|uniref:Hormone receptor 4 n=1 Tax=Polyplax serrata TaxID=468196 RepID=A0AAN8PB46_POLSC
MTLTRNPCELDTMSLFQDLKLKRRKVDSRCSSDGESVAETSTSSPDMTGPQSPCTKLTSPSPEPETPRDRTPDIDLNKKSSDHPSVKEEGDNGVFDGGGIEKRTEVGEEKNGLDAREKVIKIENLLDGKKNAIKMDCEDENKNRSKVEDKLSKDTKIKQEIIAQQEQRSHLHQEERRLENDELKRLQEELLREDAGDKKTVEGNDDEMRVEQVRRKDSSVSCEKEDLMRQQQESRVQRVHEGLRIKQEGEWNSSNQSHSVVNEQRRNSVMTSDRGPVIENHDRQWHNPVSEKWHNPIGSDRIKYSPVHSERVIVERHQQNSSGVIERVRVSPEQSKVRLSPEHSRIRLSPDQQQRLSPLIQKGSSAVQRPGCGTEQNNSGGALNMISPGAFWVNSATGGRINGVRPELIGGNVNMNVSFPSHVQSTDMKPPRPVSTPVSNIMTRQTPTVIMGEAGGVRTMIWSQPNPSSPVDHPNQTVAASTSALNWSSSTQFKPTGAKSNNNSEESAAQLLLNLGKSERPQLQQQQHQPPQSQHQQQHGMHYSQPLNMERLWAGDLTQLPASQQNQALNLALPPGVWSRDGKPQGITVIGDSRHEPEEDEQPMICMICEDRATGLHYGIITCEGCKGFFKRTVQNRRVYTCVADGNCEITKAQRNRCQYCRFKKCIEQGMVLQAVREDRMPGGRNSGAVYNLYKVKYKKHKKNPKNGQVKGGTNEKGNQQKNAISPENSLPSHVVNGTILKTALTNPSEVVHLRQRLDNTVTSSRDRTFPLDTILNMIQALVDCDEFQDIATLRNLEDLLDHKSDLSEKLCQIGDSIVYKLVQWTKRLPFYLELPVEVHTRLLTHKWHELLVLTTSAYQAIHGVHKLSSTSSAGQEADFTQEVSNNLVTLQTCLTSMMGRPITMDQLRHDVGLMVEKITHVTLMFRRVKLRMEEYVCLKVITMLNQGRGGSNELEIIQDRYMMCLKSFVEHSFPQQPTRFHELLLRLPEIQSAAALLLETIQR